MPLERRTVDVVADWAGLGAPVLMGRLHATPSRGREIFSFEYDREWLGSEHALVVDPGLFLDRGPQHAPPGRDTFGVFLDSSPDRWGRVLMQRREALRARTEKRRERTLLESDYLLGVYDGHRLGGLRFRIEGRPFTFAIMASSSRIEAGRWRRPTTSTRSPMATGLRPTSRRPTIPRISSSCSTWPSTSA